MVDFGADRRIAFVWTTRNVGGISFGTQPEQTPALGARLHKGRDAPSCDDHRNPARHLFIGNLEATPVIVRFPEYFTHADRMNTKHYGVIAESSPNHTFRESANPAALQKVEVLQGVR